MLLLEVQRPKKQASEAELRKREAVIRRLKQNYRGLFSVHEEFLGTKHASEKSGAKMDT